MNKIMYRKVIIEEIKNKLWYKLLFNKNVYYIDDIVIQMKIQQLIHYDHIQPKKYKKMTYPYLKKQIIIFQNYSNKQVYKLMKKYVKYITKIVVKIIRFHM